MYVTCNELLWTWPGVGGGGGGGGGGEKWLLEDHCRSTDVEV